MNRRKVIENKEKMNYSISENLQGSKYLNAVKNYHAQYVKNTVF
jgi:hypothetical protein